MTQKSPAEIAEQTRRVAVMSVDDFEQLPIEKRIAWMLLHDLCDRRGFKQLFNSISPELQREIQEVWETIVRNEINEHQGH